jgi:hypothetical protein
MLCSIVLAFGWLAVYVDGHNDEVQAAVLVLLVGGVALGLTDSRGRWIAAIVLGLSIVLSHAIANLLQIGTEFARSAPNFGMLIALIPALLGTGAGVVLRSMVHRATEQL